MAYRIEEKESLGAGIARVLGDRLDAAIAHLLDPADADRVHEARKRLKEARAVLRLLRGEVDGDRIAAENVALRDVGRHLSAVRDAEALLEAFAALQPRLENAVGAAAQQRVLHELQRRRDALAVAAGDDRLVPLVAQLGDARARMAAWSFDDRGFAIIEKGLARTYARGRKAYREARHRRQPEILHAWRKRVKEAWYQHQLLQRAWPEVVKGYERSLKQLSDLLGQHHDLDVLRALLTTESPQFGEGDDVSRVLRVLDNRREELERDALAIGVRFFAEKPAVFAKRWRRWWRAP
jgi:CHAD domain-containing protein